MILEVDSGGHTDLLIDTGLGDEAEYSEAVVGLVRGLEERGLGAAARLMGRRKGVEEALGEELEGLRVPLHCSQCVCENDSEKSEILI